MKFRFLITAWVFSFLPYIAFAQSSNAPDPRIPFQNSDTDTQTQVEAVADTLEFGKTDEMLIARDNVVLTYKNIQLTADYAELDTTTNKARAYGHVIVYQDGKATIKGTEVFYDFENRHGSLPDGQFISAPWRGRGAEFEQKSEDVNVVSDCSITSCGEMENPNYEIRAKEATIYAGDKIVVRNVWFYILGKPVFWWPIATIPLDLPHLPFSINVGNSTKYGTYVELSKGYRIHKNLPGKLLLDYRSERGFGGGIEQDYNFGKYAQGDLKLYWTQDDQAPTPGYTDPTTGVFNPYGRREERDRGRITLRHRTDFTPDTHLIGRYHRVADEYFLQDFFEKEHRNELQQESFATLTHNTESYGALAHVSVKTNDFEAMVEQLPSIRLDSKAKPVLSSGVLNESRLSFDHFDKRFGRGLDEWDQHVVRVDSYTRFYYPLKWKELKFMPFAAYEATYYSRERESDNDHLRQVVRYGFDTRTHLYRLYDVSIDSFGFEIDQLRHIVEPFFKVESIHSTVSDEKLNQFDLRDAIDDTASATVGFDQRFQTKRVVDGRLQRVDVLAWNTFLRYDYKPNGREGSNFTIYGNEVTLRPYNWLLFDGRLEYDLDRNHVRKFDQDLLLRYKKFRFLFGYRYIQDDIVPDGDGGRHLVLQADYRINNLWDVGAYTRWDGSDVAEWQISATRNLGCDLLFEFGFNMRDSLIDESNKEFFFNLRMQSVPGLEIRAGGNRAEISEPRIGHTVAGANEEFGYSSSSYASRYSPEAF